MSVDDVISGLVARGLPHHVAVGIAGNMSVESDGFQTDVNEYAPLVPGSRGGYGLNQWTGPRRRQFEAFAADSGVDPSSLDAQLDFTLWELNNTEARAGNALMATDNYQDAARVYSEQFLRPGIPHMDRRLAEASRINALNSHEAPSVPQEAPQSAPQNALRGYQPQFTRLNPADFQNALAAPTPTLRLEQFKV